MDLDPQQCRVLPTAATTHTQANVPCAVQSLTRLLSTFVPPIPPLVRPPFGWQRDPHVLTREISPEKQCHRRRGTGTLRPTKIEEDGVRPVLTLTQHTELHLNVYYHIGGRVLRNVSHLPRPPTTLQESSLTIEQWDPRSRVVWRQAVSIQKQ